MDFTRSETQTMMLESAERLLSGTSGVESWRKYRESPVGYDQERWSRFAELGWLYLPLPEAAGGFDGTIEDIALLNIVLGKWLSSEPFVSTVVLSAHILAESFRLDLLEQIGRGELTLALAHQEAGREISTVDDMLATARPVEGGYILSGKKQLVLDAGGVSKFIVSARIEDTDVPGLFLVDHDAPGFSTDVYALIDGTRAADLTLSNVAVPAANLLSEGSAAWKMLKDAIDKAMIANMGQAVGAMESCLDLCGSYVKERRQFAVPIGSFQGIQHMLADMYVAAHQARSMLYRAVAFSRGDDAERAAAISASRVVIGKAGQLISRTGIQIYGGYGVTDEFAISHYFRRLLSLEKQYGDLDSHVTNFASLAFCDS